MLNNDANIVNMALKISLILSYTAGMSSQNSKTWEEVLAHYQIENQPSLALDFTQSSVSTKPHKESGQPVSRWSAKLLLLLSCTTAPASITIQSYFPSSLASDSQNVTLTMENNSNEKLPKTLTNGSTNPIQTIYNLTLPNEALATYSGYGLINTESTWDTYKVERYDKLTDVFSSIDFPDILKTLQKIKPINDALGDIKPKTIVRVKSYKGSLERLVFTSDYEKSFEIKPTQTGSYEGTWKNKQFEVRQTRATFFVNSEIFADAKKNGIPQDIMRQLMAVFDWEVDFSKDVKAGDHATVIFENIYHEGDLITSLDLLAAEFTNSGNMYRSIRHTTAQGLTDYFTPEGREMKRAFIRTPITQARISSHFNPKRRHPILKKVRVHTGTDFAAPHGTPVISTGNGKVVHIAKKGGYGKTIVLKHREGYSTLYSHLSQFKKGLKNGQFVAQGDIIGYVGSTGLATGPNLHYEFRKNNVPTNPLTTKLPNSMSLTTKELEQFKTDSINMKLQLGVLHRLTMERLDSNSDIGG